MSSGTFLSTKKALATTDSGSTTAAEYVCDILWKLCAIGLGARREFPNKYIKEQKTEVNISWGYGTPLSITFRGVTSGWNKLLFAT